MLDSGTTWRRRFEALPPEARAVRRWTAAHVDTGLHPDAPLIAHELFVVVMSGGSDAVEMTLSTAAARLRIIAAGGVTLPVRLTHGPAANLASRLAYRSDPTPDGLGVWALLDTEEHES